MGEPKKVGRKLFDGKNLETVLAQCKEVWSIGGTDAEAAFFAEVSASSLSRYLKLNPKLEDFRDSLKNHPTLKARKAVVDGLEGNPELSLKYLEKKMKTEFGNSIDVSLHAKISIEDKDRELADDSINQFLNDDSRDTQRG